MQSWLKLWIEPSLDGLIRTELSPAERGVYYDLQILAKKCDQGGYLATETGKPYSERWLAARLNINRRLLQNVVQKCATLGLINDTENGIFLVRFMESQSDYYRQRKYRQPQGTNNGQDKYLGGKYGHMVRR